ncbi:MAG: 4Fe-4S binding protein [Chloroflexi bacterium]|nr:4Fe-4S binding protein [Chloroflexota bacterium]
MPVMPELDIELCDGCGLCLAACHGDGIVPAAGKVNIVETESCDFCGVCEWVCPRGAISCKYVIHPEDQA